MDIEYGGGRTVPRVAIVDFNEKVLYYTDFCMRYTDWAETKLTEAAEADEQIDKHENAAIYQNAYQKTIEFSSLSQEERYLNGQKTATTNN